MTGQILKNAKRNTLLSQICTFCPCFKISNTVPILDLIKNLQVSTDLLPEKVPKKSIPWWIILVSVLGGLLLIVIVVLILWKVRSYFTYVTRYLLSVSLIV